jgi:hypothetical protein
VLYHAQSEALKTKCVTEPRLFLIQLKLFITYRNNQSPVLVQAEGKQGILQYVVKVIMTDEGSGSFQVRLANKALSLT